MCIVTSKIEVMIPFKCLEYRFMLLGHTHTHTLIKKMSKNLKKIKHIKQFNSVQTTANYFISVGQMLT